MGGIGRGKEGDRGEGKIHPNAHPLPAILGGVPKRKKKIQRLIERCVQNGYRKGNLIGDQVQRGCPFPGEQLKGNKIAVSRR